MTELIQKISSFLDTHKVLNMAYVDHNGNSNSCALWYAHDKEPLRIYVLSSLSTNHGKELKSGGQISFTINRDDQNWQEIQGIQGKGKIQILTEMKNAWDIYTLKFSFVKNQFPELEKALEKTKIWRIDPTWIRLIDNSVSFGHKEEYNFN